MQLISVFQELSKNTCSTCAGLSRDSKISFRVTLLQFTLNPAPRGSGGQNPRHRRVGGSWMKTKKYMAKQNKKRNNGINKNNYEYGNNND